MVGEVFVSGVFLFVFLMVGKQFLIFLSVCKYLIISLCFFHLTAFRGYNGMLILAVVLKS